MGKAEDAYARARSALEIFEQLPSADACEARGAFATATVRLRKPAAVKVLRTALACFAEHPRHKQEPVPHSLAVASLSLATSLGRNREAIPLLQTAAKDPSLKLPALDALAALRPLDAEAGCAAAIEALVREPSARREKATKGCKLPRLR